jgi:hypothetical protein
MKLEEVCDPSIGHDQCEARVSWVRGSETFAKAGLNRWGDAKIDHEQRRRPCFAPLGSDMR